MEEKVRFIIEYFEGKAKHCEEEIKRCENGILMDVQCTHVDINSIASSAQLAKSFRADQQIYEEVVRQLNAVVESDDND